MKTTTVILESLGTPNLNNHVYTKECIEKVIASIKEPLLIIRGIPSNIDFCVNLTDVCGVVENIRIEDDRLIAEVEALEINGYPEMFEQLNKTLFIRPNGVGVISDDGIVSDYKFTSFTPTMTPA